MIEPDEIPAATSPNPVGSISAGYEQIRAGIGGILDAAAQAPWYVWAAVAALLILRNGKETE